MGSMTRCSPTPDTRCGIIPQWTRVGRNVCTIGRMGRARPTHECWFCSVIGRMSIGRDVGTTSPVAWPSPAH